MKAFKAFIEPFETPQRSMKIKISVYFSLRLLPSDSRNLETEKIGRIGFPRKIICPKMGKKCPKWGKYGSFLSFHKILSFFLLEIT